MRPQSPGAPQACRRLAVCELTISDWQWPFAAEHALAIGEDWRLRQAQKPSLFDGAIYLMRDHALVGDRLVGTLFRTDFKSFLYWRAHRDPAATHVRECFGAALIRSAEGHVLLGRQAPGQLNGGRIYPPSGMIDDSDVGAGLLDIDASIRRELLEETGLHAAQMQRVPGYLVATVDLQIAVAVEWRSPLPAQELRDAIMAHIAAETNPELDDIVIARTRADIDPDCMPPHACALLRTVLPA